ncbi:MAG: glyoxalase [Chloroflexi bacterium]|nr:glyoxalase [Chloroflexota bacterium]
MTGDARLGLVILAVGDMPRARAFYRSAFGWPAEVDLPVYVEFRLPAGMRLGLYARDAFARNVGELPHGVPAGSIATTELYLYPDDLDGTTAGLFAGGVRPLSPLAHRDWGDEVAYFADPDGNVIALARAAPA